MEILTPFSSLYAPQDVPVLDYFRVSFIGFTIDSLENYQVFKQKPFPLFVKTHKFAQNNYFLMTFDILDRKLNKENQMCNFSSFFNETYAKQDLCRTMKQLVKKVYMIMLLAH
jgi:hypothetical protein